MVFHPDSDFLIIGHRGAAGLVPENTLPSFARAFELGCRAVELDVYKVEHQLAVIHDEELTRTTNARGMVAALKATDLARIDAGNGAKIPTLSEVFDLAQTFADPHPPTINVELKGPNTAVPLAEFIASRKHQVPVLVSSFDHRELESFRDLDCVARVAPLYHRWDKNWHFTAQALRATAVNLNSKICSRRRIDAIRQAGYRVYVYTVNRPQRAEQLADWGVNGIFTDRPDLMFGQSV